MVNSIQSIEPLYEGKNIPPKPVEIRSHTLNNETNKFEYIVSNQEEIDLWEKLYGNQT